MPANHVLLTAVNEELKIIMEAKDDIIEKFIGKGPYEIFEQYFNDELKRSRKKPTDTLLRRIQTPTRWTNKWYHILLVRTVVYKLSKPKRFLLSIKTLLFVLMIVIFTLSIHTVGQNMVVERHL